MVDRMNPYATSLTRRAAATSIVGLFVAVLGAVPVTVASCPTPDQIQSRLGELGLERAARTARFSEPPPLELYRKASRKVGELQVDREGGKGIAVIVVELPVEVLWRAINDEDAQDEGGYMPLKRSEIIGGTPRGVSRRVFQAGERMGLGRWWVTRTVMNGELFEASDGALWEVVWGDEMEGLEGPPVDDPPDLSPVKRTRGAWLLVPLAENCTLVEHFNWSEPGGFVGMMQGLVLGRALRESIEGLVALAAAEYRTAPEGAPFVRPDGTPLDSPHTAEPEV
jgi:hypothetical protein